MLHQPAARDSWPPWLFAVAYGNGATVQIFDFGLTVHVFVVVENTCAIRIDDVTMTVGVIAR